MDYFLNDIGISEYLKGKEILFYFSFDKKNFICSKEIIKEYKFEK